MSDNFSALLKKLPGIIGIVSASALLSLPVLAQAEFTSTVEVAQGTRPGSGSSAPIPDQLPDDTNDSATPGDSVDPANDPFNDTESEPELEGSDSSPMTSEIELSPEGFEILCERFPLNSRCEGTNASEGTLRSDPDSSVDAIEPSSNNETAPVPDQIPDDANDSAFPGADGNPSGQEAEGNALDSPNENNENSAPIPDQLPDDTNDSAIPGDSFDPVNDPFNDTQDEPEIEQ
jgi:hypothetical protein